MMELLRKFKESLAKKYGAEKIVLFGSYATGAAKASSDFDLVVVCGRKEKLKMLSKLYHEWHFVHGIDRPVDFLYYTPEEFKRLSKGPTIVREAVREGVVV